MSTIQPSAPYTPPASTPAAPVEGEAVPVDVAKLPSGLASTDRALTLRGEVQAVNDDGTVRISTPRGPIDVKLPEPLPARGTDVEVQLPAGSPPRIATVTLPAQTTPPTQTPVPAPAPPSPEVILPQNTLPQQTQNPAPAPNTPAQPALQPGNVPPPIVQTPNPNAALPPSTQATATPVETPHTAQPLNSLPSGIAVLQEAGQQPAQPLSPQGLLNFLKTSMQTLMKSPDAPVAAYPTDIANPLPGAQVQRPLQIGQLARLTPLLPGQMVQPAPAAANAAPAIVSGLQISAQSTAPAQHAPITILQLNIPHTPTGAPMAQQNILQTVLGPAVNLGVQTPGSDNTARVLLPLSTTATPPVNLPTSGGTVANQMIVNNVMPDLKGAAPTPHQPVISTPAAQISTAAQTLDVRVMGLLPSMPNNVVQNPGLATLLHGTPNAPVIFASVAGQTQQGLPVVELPTFTVAADGTTKASPTLMVLQFPAKGLAPASVLQLGVLQAAQTAVPTASLPPTATAGAITWDALDEVLKALPMQPESQAAQAIVQAAIPKPGSAAFTAPVLMFVAAMRGGDISAWMGEKGLDVITRAPRRADALARVAGDFAANGKQLTDETKQPGEWRSLTLPLVYGGEVSRIHMHYHSFERDAGQNGQGEKQTGTRFIMDLSLTRMGVMQIDGFSIGNKLDVTLRSERPLSAGMREMMRTRYHDAVAGIGFAGELNFNAAPDHKGWINLD